MPPDLRKRIQQFIERPDAQHLLEKYYSGSYTGSLFDELVSPEPDRITAEDVAAVALLSVPLSGQAVERLLRAHADAISERLREVPHTPLHEIPSEGDLEPLWRLQGFLDDRLRGVRFGPVRRSKLLAHKRPHLIPIRDQHVLGALIGSPHGSFTVPLWQALRDDRIVARLEDLRQRAGRPHLSVIRTLDVIVWMATVGDAQVADPPGAD